MITMKDIIIEGNPLLREKCELVKIPMSEEDKKTMEEMTDYIFNSIDEVPTKAVTMGLASIMKAKKIVLIATGLNKADAIKGLLLGFITEQLPCSVLRNHPDVTIYVDRDAYSKVGI